MPMRPALDPLGKQHDGRSVRIEIPGGSDPELSDHAYVPFPPVALNGVSSWPIELTVVTLGLLIVRLAMSSFTIVPVPCASLMVAFVGLLKLTTNVSSGSKAVSPF